MRMRQSEGASELIRKVSPQWLSIDEATYIIIYLPSTQSIVRCNIILPFFSSCLSLALFRFLHRNCEWQKVHFSFQLRGKSERGKRKKSSPEENHLYGNNLYKHTKIMLRVERQEGRMRPRRTDAIEWRHGWKFAYEMVFAWVRRLTKFHQYGSVRTFNMFDVNNFSFTPPVLFGFIWALKWALNTKCQLMADGGGKVGEVRWCAPSLVAIDFVELSYIDAILTFSKKKPW